MYLTEYWNEDDDEEEEIELLSHIKEQLKVVVDFEKEQRQQDKAAGALSVSLEQ